MTALATGLTIPFLFAPAVFADEALSVAQQNALVQRYCAVCHTDAVRNGGISLQHFDAAQADPADAAMMVSKLKTGALGAAGVTPPIAQPAQLGCAPCRKRLRALASGTFIAAKMVHR